MSAERDEHLFGPHPKRILSLDGGGVRGLITLGMLKQVESILRGRSSNPPEFRLCDYFDLIGGTSTGALIGTMLAMGLSVDRIISIYFEMIPKIFKDPSFTAGYHTKFDSTEFERALNLTFDEILANDLGRPDLLEVDNKYMEPRLSSDVLKTGLAVIAKRIDTQSVWTITNNPKSKYWSPDSEYWMQLPASEREYFLPNKNYSLRKIVQASASAPYYLDAVQIKIDNKQDGLFVDGGVSPHNNPAAELFLITTLRGHDRDIISPTGFGWETGADKLFLLSLGTGHWQERINSNKYRKSTTLKQAMMSMRGMIGDGQQLATTWLQALSEPSDPVHVDGNLGTLEGLRSTKEPLLMFQRFNPKLDTTWLRENLDRQYDVDPEAIEDMCKLDISSLSNLNRCFEVGLETGRQLIKPDLFPENFDHDFEQMDRIA